MAHAYSPGLRVAERTTIRRRRMLPIAGEVLVARGDRVAAGDVVAKAELPGNVASVNVVDRLAVVPGDVERFMLKKVGDPVARDEVIAETRPWIKWLRSVARSPADGTIETVSKVTGQVLIRMAPRPVDVRAYLDGQVVEVLPGEGVVIQAEGVFVQGILGIGGGVWGELAVAGGGPQAVLAPGDLGDHLAGRIVLAGALITAEAYQRAADIGVEALICGGFHDRDLRRLLGYDLGVAVTGHEPLKPILILTEGFGNIPMAAATWELLSSRAGRRASACGATQIRAGVLRPEIIIPADPAAPGEPAAQEAGASGALAEGGAVRIIRHPGFGRLGVVKALPVQPRVMESEVSARVVEVELADGSTLTVPRANVEAIER